MYPSFRGPSLALLGLLLAPIGLLPATPASCANGIFLSWSDCPLGGSATSNLAVACDANTGENDLLCSFQLDQPTDSVLAVEITIDVQHAQSVLPAWWQFAPLPPGCRSGSLSGRDDVGILSACTNLWQGVSAAGGVLSYAPNQPRGLANQARIRVALATIPENARTVQAGVMYYAARVVIDNAMTFDPGACAGCSQPACLVLNAILLGRPPRPSGPLEGSLILDQPGLGHPNWVTWQGSGADCMAVPVRRATWGSIKALYR